MQVLRQTIVKQEMQCSKNYFYDWRMYKSL